MGSRTATYEMAETDLTRRLAASALENESLKRELGTVRSLSKAAASEAVAALVESRERVSELQAQLAS
jgi:hypothetical protein